MPVLNPLLAKGLVRGMTKALIAVASVCLAIAVVAPVTVYSYFCYRLNAASESYELQISDLQQENEELREEVRNLTTKAKDPYLMDAYLVAYLGWYLHDSGDPVNYSRNKLTIYGTILNIGAKTAVNCKLQVKFYHNTTLLQTSESKLDDVKYWSYKSFKNYINCEVADSVTKIEVERFWSNKP